jgi:nucleoside-diphosphate-sugar epimerase
MQAVRVLVVGAAQAPGPSLVRRLMEGGHDVVALTSGLDAKPMLEGSEAPVQVVTYLRGRPLREAMKEARPIAVVLLRPRGGAGEPRSFTGLRRNLDDWYGDTEHVTAAAAAEGAKRLIVESSLHVYGFGNLGDRLLTEEDGRYRGYYNPWRREQVAWSAEGLERWVFRRARRYRLGEALVLRFGNLYGPSTNLAQLPATGWPLVGGGHGVGSWIHTGDAASAVLAALDRGRAGETYNIVDDEPVSYRELVLEMCRLSGAPPPPEQSYLWQRLLAPYPAFQMAKGKVRVSNAKAKGELGWSLRYPTFREGLRSLPRPPVV